MKLLIDMNLSPLWVPFLAARGIDGWIVFTHDLDFGALLAASGESNPSVIQVRGQDVLPSAIGEAVVSAIGLTREHLESGALVIVDIARHRTRILPLVL